MDKCKMSPKDSKIFDDETTKPLNAEANFEAISELSSWGKFKYAISNITVEPALGVFIFSSVLAILATQNLNLEKACRVNLKFNDDVCTALKLRHRENLTHEEEQVQKLIASVYTWRSAVHTSVPTILILFIGAWSDKTGRRKICMLMPIFGEFMTSVLTLMNAYFFYEVPVEGTVLMEVIFPSLTGGWSTMFLGAFSYLGDITSKETRTFRFGLLSLCMTLGFPIGMGLSGVLLKSVGYYGVFIISASLKFFNFCYVLFYLKDHTWLSTKDQTKKPARGFLLEFFDFKSLRNTINIVFKKGPNNRRIRICLVLTVVCLYFGPVAGEHNVAYIFYRYKFNWNEVKYSIYATASFITHAAGTLFLISVFSKKLGVDDAVLGIISTSSKICGALLLAFAQKDYQVFLVPLVEILNGTTPTAVRSIASKLVSHQELGKVYSLFAITETSMSLIFGPLYSKTYMATLKTLPGAVFLLSVAAAIPALMIFVWFYRQHKRDRRKASIASSPESTDLTSYT